MTKEDINILVTFRLQISHYFNDSLVVNLSPKISLIKDPFAINVVILLVQGS